VHVYFRKRVASEGDEKGHKNLGIRVGIGKVPKERLTETHKTDTTCRSISNPSIVTKCRSIFETRLWKSVNKAAIVATSSRWLEVIPSVDLEIEHFSNENRTMLPFPLKKRKGLF